MFVRKAALSGVSTTTRFCPREIPTYHCCAFVAARLPAAAVLARDPRSSLTQAVKLWGDDEEPFRNLIISTTSEAKEWRNMMGKFIRHLKPDESGRSVFRGWYFPTKAERIEFLKPILESRFFESERVGMSASRSR